ncbi:MAG: T9SS type A sorting domain-containing protein, partial [Bacteroidales bacterium]|nr:T9SS type A sorting domain-containing protein [Bacteroidales bacterium]
YNHGATCTLTATANTGYNFINWTLYGDEYDTIPTIQFEVTDTLVFAANFELINYDITAMVTVNPTEGGTVTGAGNYNYGQTCTLTAVPATGYHFVNWTKNGQEVSTNLTYTFEVTEAAEYAANFAINNYNIAATANPAVGGTVTGAGTYNHFEEITLTATEGEGYTFVNWTENGQEVATTLAYTFTVTGPRTLVANFSLNSYDITASANPAVGGTVTGAGTYNHFEEITLTATEGEGYTFVNWTENGQEVATTLAYTFTVTGPRTLVANFSLNSYDITASANPAVGGTVTGAGTYNHFEEITLTATEGEGYTFVNWTENGQEVATTLAYTFTVTGPRTLVANFSLNSYDIAASANPTVGGTVTGAGTYNHFEEITLTATEGEGYTFVNWTENGQEVATTLAYTFTVTGPRTLVANFSLNNYEITVSGTPSTGGEVSGAGTYDHFATCTLTATPAEGYHFEKWTLNGTEVSTSATYSFTVTGEAAYVAHFQRNRYAITVNHTTGGTVTGAGNYYHFAICTLRAIPSTGYHFVNWTENGQEVATTTTYTFTVTEARTLMANFEQNTYTITAIANPTAGGAITGAGDYTHGEICTLTATSNPGYYFVNWTKGNDIVSTDEVYSFEVTESATYRAHFEQFDYVVLADANPEDGGTITGTGEQFHYGQTCQLNAQANTGYHFVNWTLNGVEVSTSNIYTLTVTESVHYVANFELDTFEITAIADPEEGGVITGAGTYTYGQEVVLSAEPNPDFIFVNWTEGDEVVSEDNRIIFNAEEDRQLVAHFISTVGLTEQYSLTVSVYPNPTTSQLTIEASEPVKMLEIYTINGALVGKQVNCSDKIVLDVENYVSGTYMIRLTTDKTVGIRKFVKE